MMRLALIILSCTTALLAESAAGVKWTAPAGWTSKGATQMRAATYDVDGSECVVYFFGPGQGGTVEANIARWSGQFTQNGKPAQPKIVKRTMHDLNVTTMDVTGSYAGMSVTAVSGPVMSQEAPKPDYRMLAAVVEAAGGNIFIKFAAPAKTIAANQQKFEQLVASFQKQ